MDGNLKATDSVAFNPAQLDKLFPFHVHTDAQLRVNHLGPGLSRLIPELRRGDLLPQFFKLVRPSVPFLPEELRQSLGLLILLETPSGVTMRGQFQALESGGFLYLGSPWLNSLRAMNAAGLDISDFAPHDPTVELLHLLQLQKMNLEDQGRLVLRMSGQSKELNEAHRQMAQELSDRIRAEALTRSILDTAVDAIVTIDEQGLIQTVNPAFERLFGYTPEDILGRNVSLLMAEPQATAHDGYILRYLKTGEKHVIGTGREVEGLRKDGTPCPLLLSVGVFEVEGKRRFTGVLHDIRESRAAREQEVEIASRIQQTLLFGSPPVGFLGLDLSVLALPSQKVDGDFFDFYRYGGETLDLLIGDVMGKGIPAALLGAAAKTHLQRVAAATLGELRGVDRLPTPADLVNRLHAAMGDHLIGLNSFITLCYARLDLRQMRLELVDCGHPGSLLIRSGQPITRLSGPNVPLGFLPEEHYQSIGLDLLEGDLLVLYSDGLTEATDRDGELFGNERLEQAAQAAAGGSSTQVLAAIQAEIEKFLDGQKPGDDLTCLVVQIGRRSSAPILGHRELELRSDPYELPLLRQTVQAFLDDYFPNLDEVETYRLMLAVNEAVANIIRHAYSGRKDGWTFLTCDAGSDWVSFAVYHRGIPLDPQAMDQVAELEEPSEGGMGLFLIKSCCDQVEVNTNSEGLHSLTMWRRFS